MGLSVGERLGRFEIVGVLGAGGMGEVYRARDSQLRRDIAIKILRGGIASDAEQERRFEREARAAASLTHPNIVAVHDVGIQDGVPFIVTELLDGESLRNRIGGKPVPPRRALEYALQIVSGLAAGHDRGIVHRDIKPDNVFVTADGRIKILDFGLAKMMSPEVSGDVTQTLTIDGVPMAPVMGTASYMSPEQVRGLHVDHRSDIFSFGVLLYEMLTGVAPFRRDTTADTFSAILNEEPRELSMIAPVAPGLERVVQHCLEKKQEHRFQSARDLAFALESLQQSSSTSSARASDLRPRSKSMVLVAAGALAVASAAALGYVAGRVGTDASSEPRLHTARRVTDFLGLEEFPTISPDGRSVAFTASVDGTRQIFVRRLAGGPPLVLTKDAVDHQRPRWVPGGDSLLYFSPAASGDVQGAIWQIPALGGPSRRIMASVGDADVSRDGRVACFQLADQEIRLVTAALDGSDARVIVRGSSSYYRHPRWSPDGRWIAFQRGDGIRDDILVVAAGGGDPRQVTHDRSTIGGLTWRPSSDGILFSSSRGSTIPYLPPLGLWDVGLDGGAPRPVAPLDVSYEQPDGHHTGVIATTRMTMRFDLWTFPVDGTPRDNVSKALQITHQTGRVLTPTASPNGDEIAFLADSGGHANLWVVSQKSGDLRQITFESAPGTAVGVPVWSPDGRSIAFVSSRDRTGFDFGIWLVNPDGGNLRNLVKAGLGPTWSPDGTWLYYTEMPAGVLYKVPSTGGTPIRVTTDTTRNPIGVADGTAYYMVERPLLDGRPEFEIRAASPESGPSRVLARIPASRVASWQIVNPALSPDGQWLALPLTDGFTTNVWTISTTTGAWRQITDFGDRAVFIARRVSWSADSRSIIASVGEGDADVVLLEGLYERRDQ